MLIIGNFDEGFDIFSRRDKLFKSCWYFHYDKPSWSGLRNWVRELVVCKLLVCKLLELSLLFDTFST